MGIELGSTLALNLHLPNLVLPNVVIYLAFCLDVAQGHMNGAPSET